MFKKINTFKSHHQIIFAIIIGVSLICFWRGVWGLLDMYLLPNNEELSYWASLAVGLFILYGTNYIVKELM